MNCQETQVCSLPGLTRLIALLPSSDLSFSLSGLALLRSTSRGIFLKLKSDHMVPLWKRLLCPCLCIVLTPWHRTQDHVASGLCQSPGQSHPFLTCTLYALVILSSLEIWNMPCFFHAFLAFHMLVSSSDIHPHPRAQEIHIHS